MPKQPNILLLVNDHQAYYRHGWDGGVRPQTPHFDRIAQEGVRFERAYCATPLCGPARRTLLTGLYPHNHHNFYNYSEAPYNHEIYLSRLAQAGYRNYYFGKWHAGPGTAHDFGCRGWSDTDYGNPYISTRYAEYLEEYELERAEHHVEFCFTNGFFARQFPQLKAGTRYQSNYAWCGEHAVGLTTTPKETHEAFFLADLAGKALDECAAAPDDQPFHLRVDFWGPHQPHFPTQEFADLYDPAQITEYGSFRDTLENKPAVFHHDLNQPLVDEQNRFQIPSPLTWPQWQQIVARAYAHATLVDAAAGRILERLDALGLAENTVVIWTADHGDALASHGGRFDKGSYLTEEVVRVPLAMRYPGVAAPGQINKRLICSTDIAPTLLDLAGAAFANQVDGRSFLPLVNGEQARADFAPWRTDLMVETFGHGFGIFHMGRALITEQYKYVDNDAQLHELYDLHADPYQLQNLIHHPETESTLVEMRARLRQWQKLTDDAGVANPAYQQALVDEAALLDALVRRRTAKAGLAAPTTG
ncbi:MAG: sulfatase-like hydrolase/transferase [Caldilineaceae bacterium]